ncbi:MAG: hypothetical protein ABIJ34_02430 [archaeon]
MLTIRYLGNELVKEDKLAIELAEHLQKRCHDIKFEKMDTMDDIMFIKDSIFMDVCDGITKARLIDDIDVFENIRSSTAHDIDFGFFLKLNKELGELKKVKIICLPKNRYPNIEEDVLSIIENLEGKS